MGHNPNGIILYEGPSMLDGTPIVCIVTGIKDASANGKTGAMLQTFIMLQDVSPVDAVKSGADSSVCGQCAHRPALKGDSPCYVKVFHAPRSVWNCYRNGAGYRTATALDRIALQGQPLRAGTYGDPAAVPATAWPVAARRTGYTHQWADAPEVAAPFRAVLMASVDSVEEASAATAAGWRYFRVETDPSAPLLPNEVRCPASEEAGKRSNCEKCGLCNGNPHGVAGRARVPANVVILDHSTQGRARNRRARLALA